MPLMPQRRLISHTCLRAAAMLLLPLPRHAAMRRQMIERHAAIDAYLMPYEMLMMPPL